MKQISKAADRGLISSPRSDALFRGEIKEAGTVADRKRRIKAWFGSLKDGKWDRRKILTVVGALIVLVALCGLIFTFLEYHRSDSIYGKAEKEYVTVPGQADVSIGQASGKAGDGSSTGGNAGNDSTGGSETADDPAVVQRPWYEQISVDLEGLQAAYPDVAGWLYFENESISYPVMYSGDNEKYLRTAYTGKAANADSSIYYVYGTEPDAESFKSLIKDLKKISMLDTGVEVGSSDHIITLSTCTGDGDVRMIVSAVRMDEYRR